MKAQFALALLTAGALLAGAGCVERKMLIRSEPSGVPVWVDERYAGTTLPDGPLEYPFAHYGTRRIRVGPLRDENEKLVYHEMQRVVDIEPPWYETFPIDFFFEVLLPWRLTDEHVLPVFALKKAEEGPQRYDRERIQELREQAEAFRERALRTIPEEAPSE